MAFSTIDGSVAIQAQQCWWYDFAFGDIQACGWFGMCLILVWVHRCVTEDIKLDFLSLFCHFLSDMCNAWPSWIGCIALVVSIHSAQLGHWGVSQCTLGANKAR